MKPERLVGLDVLKSFLTCKIAAAHLFVLAGFNALYKPVSIGKPFTFGVLLFCFGLGLGLSTRKRDARPLLTLIAAYLLGSLVLFATMTPERMAWNSISIEELRGLVSFTVATQYVEYVLPFAFFYSLILLFQLLGVRLRALHWSALIGLGLLIHWAGVYLNRFAPDAPGSAFYAEGFRTLQYAPVFFSGMALAAARSWLTPKNEIQAPWIWLAVCAAVAVNILSPHILQAVGLTLFKFRALGSLKASIVIIGIAVAELMIIQALASRYSTNAIVGYFSRVGRKLPLSLSIQVVTVPPVALLVQSTGGAIGYLIAIAYLSAFLVVLDRWPRARLAHDSALGSSRTAMP